jgi:aminoglycoside phosphotransferase (APT) family kinase protein
MPVTGLSAGPSPASKLAPEGVRSIFETLAFLHSLPVEGLAKTCVGHWLECGSLAQNTAEAVRLYEEQPFWWPAETSPTLSAAMSWLKANIPEEDAPVSLLHVDYGVHNLMMENDRVSAVLDWENARIGDPAEDITFALFSLGPDVDREQALTWYREAGGHAISENRLRFFDVYNMMKVASAGAFSAGLLEEDGNAALEWSALALNMIGGCAGSLMLAIEMAEVH